MVSDIGKKYMIAYLSNTLEELLLCRIHTRQMISVEEFESSYSDDVSSPRRKEIQFLHRFL